MMHDGSIGDTSQISDATDWGGFRRVGLCSGWGATAGPCCLWTLMHEAAGVLGSWQDGQQIVNFFDRKLDQFCVYGKVAYYKPRMTSLYPLTGENVHVEPASTIEADVPRVDL